MQNILTIQTPSRLHITLIDMNGSQGRIDGSAGIALNYPRYKIRFSKSAGIKVNGCDDSLKAKIIRIIELFYKNYPQLQGLDCEVVETIPSHRGLGGGTQLSLAIAQAFNLLYGLKLSISQLAGIVQRGGASSLGAYFFSKGGFLIDGGHNKEDKELFLPSSFVKSAPLSPILFHHKVPGNWKFVLCIPRQGEGLSGLEEKDFMTTTCPIEEHEVEKACRIILMKMLPAVKEKNFMHFCESISYLQENGWKKYHWKRAANQRIVFIKDILENIGLHGVGLSSTGNTIFGLYKHKMGIEDVLRDKFYARLKEKNIDNSEFTLIFSDANVKGSTYSYDD
jgi:beta-ribofuranosylaminobenzene 5'-phosphate synthase